MAILLNLGTGAIGLDNLLDMFWAKFILCLNLLKLLAGIDKENIIVRLTALLHIQKIIETYRTRAEIEKYSHCATLKEIEENDYNLNIPRYVDTFEEEEEIDIKAVMAEIKELESKRTELDAQIEVYLKELGIVE